MDLGAVGIRSQYGFHSAAVLGDMIAALAHMLAPTAHSMPMLDESVVPVLAAALTAGVPLGEAGVAARANELALLHRYLGALTSFPSAPIEAVLGARHELAPSLIRFRAALADYSREVGSMIIDDGFAQASDDLYRRVLAPQLAELDELASEGRVLHALRQQALSAHGGTVVKATLGLAIAAQAAWPEVMQAAVGALVAGADIASATYRRLKELDLTKRQNKLVWLYDLSRRAPA